MNTHPIARIAAGSSMILAPLFGLVAAVATPGLDTTNRAEIVSIARHPDAFYVYAVAILVSSYLLIPAFFGLMNLIRQRSVRWAYVAGGVAQVGMVIAVGDAATELMYSRMGAPSADPDQMVSLANRYDSVSGAIYAVGGLAVVIGTVLVAVALWRTAVVPRWTAVALVTSVVLNIAGFSAGNQAVLLSSYVVMLAGLGWIGIRLVSTSDEPAEVAPAASTLLPSAT